MMDYEKFNDKQISDILLEFGDPRKLKLAYISTYIPNYIRTESILNIFQRNGIKAETIFLRVRNFKCLSVFLKAIFKLGQSDVIFLGFRGHEILPILRLITKKPIIFDAFVSVYDTLCLDRKIFKSNSIIGRILKSYDAYLCRLADAVLVDTKTHCEYFMNEFNAKNISYVYLEPNKDLFKPTEVEKKNNKFIVFWYGYCWPLQGVEVILEAAEILKDDPRIVFRLVGPVRRKFGNLVRNLDVWNIEFINFISYERLPYEIAAADVCLAGHFSGLPKASRVIPGKAFHFIACGKKTILGDNPANRELFSEKENIYFVKMNSAKELARKILEIKSEAYV